jgi:hypothetical protein
MIVTVLIPLPVFHNPDEQGRREPIEDERFMRTAEEISEMFHGGGTLSVFRDGQVRGFWWDRGVVDKDVLALLEVDLEDTPANRERVRAYARDVLKERFSQKAIYVKWIGPIETWIVKDEEEIE